MENFSYSRPVTVKEAASQLGKEFGKTVIMAGGTDLFGGEMKDNLIAPERIVHIRHIKELQGIRTGRGSIRIGTSTLLSDIVESDVVQQRVPLLAMAASHVGTVQIDDDVEIGAGVTAATSASPPPGRTISSRFSWAARRSSFTRRTRRLRSWRLARRRGSWTAADVSER